MLLLIDNYDSFTWNLYQYFCELGAQVQVVRNDAITLEQMAALPLTHLVISLVPARRRSQAFRWRRSGISPVSCRCWASAWAIRQLRRRMARRSCVRVR